LIETLLVVLVLRLQRLDLGRDELHAAHRLGLLDGQRHEQRADDDGQGDDREAPAEPDRAVEEEEDLLEQVDHGLQRLEDGEGHLGVRGGGGPAADGARAEEGLGLDGIVTAPAPGIAPQQAPTGQHDAP
jgi:hypothetical protein